MEKSWTSHFFLIIWNDLFVYNYDRYICHNESWISFPDITVRYQEKRLEGSKLLKTNTEHLLIDSSTLHIDQKEKLKTEKVKIFEHK